MYHLATEVLNPQGTVELIANPGCSGSLPEGRKFVGIIQGDSVPQLFIPKMISLYEAGRFPFDRLVKFYNFLEINQAIADARRGDIIKPGWKFLQEDAVAILGSSFTALATISGRA
jgi:aryl-alcohol dehydrogenase